MRLTFVFREGFGNSVFTLYTLPESLWRGRIKLNVCLVVVLADVYGWELGRERERGSLSLISLASRVVPKGHIEDLICIHLDVSLLHIFP